MGLPGLGSRFPEFSALTFRNFLLGLVKDILLLLISHLHLLGNLFSFNHGTDDYDQVPEDRPSPSLVPVPVHLVGESIKEQLPVVQYSNLLERRGACKAKESVCAVCLNCMEASDEVRELCNCCHVFHKECLDVWIGQGQLTCPLCRSKLSSNNQKEKLGSMENGEDGLLVW